jgi:RHS repeat-associated protein
MSPNTRYLVVKLLPIFLLSCFPSPLLAQSPPDIAQGLTPYGSYMGGKLDSVNLNNGNVTLHIPLVSYPQRGGKLDLSFFIRYNNKGWHIYRSTPTAQGYWEFSGGVPQVVSNVDTHVNTTVLTGTLYGSNNEQKYYFNYSTILTPDGGSHEIVGTETIDATGMSMNGTTAIDRNGIQYNLLASTAYNGTGTVTDPNGNEITIGTSGWTDTLGRLIPGTIPSGGTYGPSNSGHIMPGVPGSTTNCPSGSVAAMTWNLPGFNGTTPVMTFCFANYAVQTAFNFDSVVEASGTETLLNAIILPNLTMWQFNYDSYLDLTSIILPTGGSISYTWTTVSFQGSLESRALASRTVNANDGTGNHTWNYQWLTDGGVFTGTSIMTDPGGNDTVTQGYFFPSVTQYYQGSHTSGTLLKTVTNVYSSEGDPLWMYTQNLTANFNVFLLSSTTAWANGQTTETTYTPDSGFGYLLPNDVQGGYVTGTGLYGLTTQTNSYDYGSGSPGPLLRQTNNTYMAFSGPNASSYLAKNMLTLPYTVQVLNGSGTQAALTQYNYDETSLATSGMTSSYQWNPSPPAGTYRGNNTSVYRWLNSGTLTCPNGKSAGSNSYVISKKIFYDAGMLNTSSDPCGDTTTYAYSPINWYAFPATITNALGQKTTNTYDYNTGLLGTTTDPNSLTTTFSYDNMWRLSQVKHPDGGVDTITHQETTYPFTATLTSSITSSLNKVETNVFDGLGRLSQHQLTTDPDGASYTVTTYDGMGRAYQVYNATRCNPPTSNCGESTWGYTTSLYDALGRSLQITEQDGSIASVSYAGNCSTATDEAGNARTSCSDGLGRLTQVNEPGASASTPGTGSATIDGSEQSITGLIGSGTVALTGTLQSKQVQTQAATAGTGSVTISGSERSTTINLGGCSKPPCSEVVPETEATVYDTGTVSITVNGVVASTTYGQGSTSSSLASALASSINGSSSFQVTAAASGSTITLTAKTSGASTNYSLSATSATTYTEYFSGTSFPVSTSGATLTGGANAVYTTAYDSGTCTVVADGHSDSDAWSGSGTTISTIASGLASAINADTSAVVSATSSGGTLSLTSKTSGADYPLSSSCTYNSSYFSSPSFTATSSSATAYDSGTVSITVAGFQASASYGQGSSSSTVAAALANALNVTSSPVTAVATGSTINLTANAAGANTNYPLSVTSSTSQPGNFPGPSFTVSLLHATLINGATSPLTLSNPVITAYTYDPLNDLISVVQNGSRQRNFSYDSLARLTSSNNPESGAISYSYDPIGNLSTKIAPAANQPSAGTTTTTNYTYDALNRLTQKSYSDGTPTNSYAYDGNSISGCTLPSLSAVNGIGRRTAMCDAAGSEAWSYPITSGTGWSTKDVRITLGITLTTSAQNNLNGSIYTLTYPSGDVFTYTPGGAGSPLSVADSNGITYGSSAHYWPAGTLASVMNGVNSQSEILNNRMQPCWIYDTTGSPLPFSSTTCSSTATTGSILDVKYNFGFGSTDNGNVTGITNNRDATRSQSFTYDALNRLLTAQSSSTYATNSARCWSEAYNYDPWGNLLSISLGSPSYAGCVQEPPLAVTVNANNQFQSSTACFSGSTLLTTATYCYDAAGNLMTNTSGASFSYDAENNIKSAMTLGINYVYDGDGRRVAKLNSSGQATKLYWYGTGTDPLDETDGTGTNNDASFFEYAFFNGQRVARRDYQSNVDYYFSDHLGTARVVTNSAGTILDDSDFYPFGGERVVVTPSSGNSYLFTGKERDSESGLDNFGARYFGSSMGRFTSPDIKFPTIRYLVNPQKLNRYSYVHNNPLAFIDPDGLDDWFIFRPLIGKNSPGTGDWTNAVKAAQERGDTVHMLKGPDANVKAYNDALNTPGAHVVVVTHTSEKNPSGSIQLADGVSSGQNGFLSQKENRSADPAQPSTLEITTNPADTTIPVSASEVAIFGCDSQSLAGQYTDTSFIGVDPGASGGISFWLGGNSAAAFLQAGGGQAGVDAANAQVLKSQDPQDTGASVQLNPPQPPPPPPPPPPDELQE